MSRSHRNTVRHTGLSIRAVCLVFIGLVALVATAWAFLSLDALPGQWLAWVVTMQTELHRQLAQAMRAAAGQESWLAAMPLIGLSFLYGVFHAAGPGHGKAVMATYLGTSRERLSRGLLLSTLAALIQGLTAILLVEFFVDLLGLSLRHTQRVGAQFESVSFALVAALGAVLAAKGAAGLYRQWRRSRPSGVKRGTLFAGGTGMRVQCADCGALHDLAAMHTRTPLRWRTGLSIALAIGIRPCVGALLVLLVAHSMGSRWTGIAAVMAMSAGTAITVGALSAGVMSARAGIAHLFANGRRAGRLPLMLETVSLTGGVLICLLGLGLLRQALQTQAHPLM